MKGMHRLKYLYVLLFFATLFIACSQPQKVTLTILHTNDTHSQIDPKGPSSKENANRGGVQRRLALIKQEREKDKDLLLLDAGDFGQGTPYFNIYHGRLEVEIMNQLGYDVGTLGNHEFDNGKDTLAEVLKLAKFQVVCANYKVDASPLKDLVKPYVILERKGVKIGIFGLGVSPESLIDQTNFSPIEYLDPISCANSTAKTLRDKGCELIVCVSHLGTEFDGENTVCDKIIAEQSHDIDIIVGGHIHKIYEDLHVKNADGKDVLLAQSGFHGINVGKITINLE